MNQYIAIDSEPVAGASIGPMAPGKKVQKQREKPALRVLGSYGLAVSALRKRKGLRQADLIAAAKVAPRTASGAESSENVTLAVLDALLAAMGANIVDFAVALAEVQGGTVLEAAQPIRRERIQRRFVGDSITQAVVTDAGALQQLVAQLDELQSQVREIQIKDRIRELKVLEAELHGRPTARRSGPKEEPD